MKALTTKLMQCINKAIIENKPLDKKELNNFVIGSDVDSEHKSVLLKIIDAYDNPSMLNKHVYDYNYNLEMKLKNEKLLKKFKNQENNKELEKDYFKFKDYIYSIISTPTYKSKISKSKAKVKLINLNTLFGHDSEELFKDLSQEGKLYLWEGLKKFGVLPSKGKNFNNRFNEGYERHLSGKSTFLFSNLVRSFINLGKKANSEKFYHIDLEFKPELIGENEED